jgi:flagellar biosynthesis/type III secretory pathway protein FliH
VEAGEEVALMIAAEDRPFPREEAFNKKEEVLNTKEEAFNNTREEDTNKKEEAFNNMREEGINKKEEAFNKIQEVAGGVPFIVDEGVFRIAIQLLQWAEVMVGITKGGDEDVADFVDEGGINGLAAQQ